MFADYHVHTEYSDDSIYPMKSVITDAIYMGLEFGVQTQARKFGNYSTACKNSNEDESNE